MQTRILALAIVFMSAAIVTAEPPNLQGVSKPTNHFPTHATIQNYVKDALRLTLTNPKPTDLPGHMGYLPRLLPDPFRRIW
jgi:hypothetical protein